MAVETDVFRSTLLSDFGQSVTLTPISGSQSTFTAIFDAQHIFEEVGGSVAYSVQQPKLTCRTTDVNAVVEGDSVALIVEGTNTTYKVRAIMPDGTGFTELQLEEQ